MHGSRLHPASDSLELKKFDAVLLDIEGTTTPIDFVHKTLFGFARARVTEFLGRHWNDAQIQADIARLRAEHAAELARQDLPPWGDDCASVVAYLQWLMDQDRKSTGLKSIQGKIWEEGYRSGALRGEVYADVRPALERWRDQRIDIAIFSSGSVQAQRSLFSSSTAGDLTRLIRNYFDTTTGAKTEPKSYTSIAAVLGRSASDVLFVSDVTQELDAAGIAGMQTALCVRGLGSAQTSGGHRLIHTFDQLFFNVTER